MKELRLKAQKQQAAKVKCYAEGGAASDSPDMLERIARYVSNGRNLAHRRFYNSTRSGLYNSATPPDEAYPYGGLGRSLKDRRRSDMLEAQSISDAVPRRGDPNDQVDEDAPPKKHGGRTVRGKR